MPSAEYILRRSLCRTPSCAGPHELRDTPLADWPQSERESWQHSARQYVENMNYCAEYGEPGYSNPQKMILFSNWNLFPSKACGLLESAGYKLEWEDEWSTCDGCNKAFRTSPDSYQWQPSMMYDNGGYYCADCLREDDSILEDYIDNPRRAVNLEGLDLTRFGYVEIQCGFSAGWSNYSDNPQQIMESCKAQGYRNIVFQISSQSQFECGFCVWHKPCGECGARGWKYATRDDGRRAIERCDECEAIESDEAAAVVATAAGFVCSLEYPCFVSRAPRCECGAEYDDSCI